jgi:hypothetical protein
MDAVSDGLLEATAAAPQATTFHFIQPSDAVAGHAAAGDDPKKVESSQRMNE